jgi:DNA gyrase/topoisomerase IV subunit A
VETARRSGSAAGELSLHKDVEVKDLLKRIKGPDFPTGGQILDTTAS